MKRIPLAEIVERGAQAPAPAPLPMMTYFVIVAGGTNLMARFDRDGRLVEWTDSIRRASLFLSQRDGADAIRSMCSAEFDAAVRSGKAVRELDDETGETVVMDYSGRRARPMRTPGIRVDRGVRMVDDEPGPGREPIRRFVRAVFQAARQNPTRASAALLSPRSDAVDDYTMPASRRARIAGMARALPGG